MKGLLTVIAILLALIAAQLGAFAFLGEVSLSGWIAIVATGVAWWLGGVAAAVIVGVASLLLIGAVVLIKAGIQAREKDRRERFIQSLASLEEWDEYCRNGGTMPISLWSKVQKADWLAANPGKTERDYLYMWHKDYERTFPGSTKVSDQYAPKE